MQTYLVGGAVRDRLLNLPIHERDWVVVGATSQDMLAKGFKQVGKDFPVFIHPTSGEQYALARTERKTAQGHTGFIVHSSPDISLQEDLFRRDLTINAIAEDEHGLLIDPYGGEQDLQNRVLRHVSPAFSEDPLRVLRVARFAAKLFHLEFKVADETLELMRSIAHTEELTHLSRERIWQETQSALITTNPEVYFLTLMNSNALKMVFPNLANELIKKEKQEKLMRLNKIEGLDSRYVAMILIASQQGNGFSNELVNSLNECFASPGDLQEFSILVARNIMPCNQALELSNEEIHALLKNLDGFRRMDRCVHIFNIMRDANEVLNLPASPSLVFLSSALTELANIKLDTEEIRDQHGEKIAANLTALRCDAIDKLRANF